MTSPDSLTREELAQYVYLSHGLFLEYQSAYYLSQEGTLDASLRESLVNTIGGVREMPGFRQYWNQRRDLFDPGFRAFVDNLVAEGETNTNLEQLYRRE